MPHAKLTVVLILAIAAGAVGAFVVHAEFFGNSMTVDSKSTVAPPSSGWLKQHVRAADRAAQRSATQGMRDDCAALQKLGTTDPECAQLNLHR